MKKIKKTIGLLISAIALYALAFGLELVDDEEYIAQFRKAMREL